MSESRRIVIAGTGSGAGKTTVTLGLLAALKRRGHVVQGFKCGPDYIDPTYHTAVTGRASRNLDSFMLSPDAVREIFVRGSEGADISIIEGVMGMYDGKEPTSDRGSTAEISILTDSPILLVVNCQSIARSAAAIVKGFQLLNPAVRIVAVIANKVGSEGHYKIVKSAIEQECAVPVVGYLKREEAVEIPERHLGLIPSVERGELDPLFARLAELMEETVEIERIWELAKSRPLHAEPRLFAARRQAEVAIAVAKDSAFHFYYPENLELLEAYGARLLFFSPLAGESVPEQADGLYIGGGFPEEFAAELSAATEVLQSVRRAIRKGLPTLAECGGFMYLTEAIVTTSKERYPMAGIIPGQVAMQKKLAALGYREVKGASGNFLLGPEETAKGHEFHYSIYQPAGELPHAYVSKGLRGSKQEGYTNGNLVAGFTHLHFASNPGLAKRWIARCREVRDRG